MLKKISLRWRLTLLTSLLIALCCIGLSIVLNVSAYRMADSIDAFLIQPAQAIGTDSTIPMTPTTSTATVKHSYLMESLLYTITAVLTGGFLTYWIAGKALEPVRALNEQVKNINAHNLEESLEIPPTRDELAELTASFNNMTDKLAQAFAMQKRFSADAAHELRTPLTVLQTKLDVFRKKKAHTPEEYEALAAATQKQVKRLRSLVTELLAIANSEHEFARESVPIASLLSSVTAELAPLARERHITLSLDCGAHSVSGAYDSLYRAFYNLAENAIKYNIENGSVFVRAAEAGRNIVVTIKDTGIGIPENTKKQIFDPFYRVDKSRSRELGGAGLGLSLADSIIRQHGGTISVSDVPGSGSCFTVTLPIE